MPADPITVLARLVATHQELLRWLQARVGGHALAEAILRDAFVHGERDDDDPIDDGSLDAWFVQALLDAVDLRRRRGVGGAGLAGLAAQLRAGGPAGLHRVIRRCVARLADNLNPGYTRVLRRVELDGLTLRAFAAEVEVDNLHLVVVQAFLAREALREQLRRACLTRIEHDAIAC